MKILIDTCIILDALQDRKPFSEDAQNIFLAVANQKVQGFLSAKSVTDLYDLLHRHTQSNQESRKILNKLFVLFGILDTTAEDCRKAVFSEMNDYEDAVMAESALRCDMDGIVTRNTKDYEKAAVSIFSPKQLLEEIENNVDE